ncbi:hypothetical protein [Pseudogemmobacter bohemicus]|uniref:hypothetical protein n=1 Tax=Pseudogemmobacter bohemicus TaxID=2250708 RepID=UPI0013009358|nr:hypothetical protein [Pseudogemmobacter bohemicus]
MRSLSLTAMLIGTALALAPIAAAPALAQGVSGKAMVDGRVVTLFDDRTWRFDEATEGCETLSARLEFCGAAAGWTIAQKPTPDYTAAYRLTDRLYGGFIVEEIGTDQGLTPEAVRKLLLEILQGAMNVVPVVIANEPATIDGKTGETLVYGFRVDGIDVVYANSFLLSKGSVLQVLTYEVGVKDYSDAHRRTHDGFVAATRFNAD